MLLGININVRRLLSELMSSFIYNILPSYIWAVFTSVETELDSGEQYYIKVTKAYYPQRHD